MPRKAVVKKEKVQSVKHEEKKKGINFFDYLRFGESYTSLILGIIVVIIATALLLSFVHNKNAGNVNPTISEQTQNTVQVSQQTNNLAQRAPSGTYDNASTVIPTESVEPTKAARPTAKPVIRPTSKPTVVAKKTVAKANPTPTIVMKKVVKTISNKTKIITATNNNVWVVQKDESLWSIAEKKYGSGYNWVDIAHANNLADPSDIHVGDRLILPQITPLATTLATPTPTVMTNDEQFSSTTRINEIKGTSYIVEKGDTLWDIAVRAYGDGYRWTDIEKANNLANPGLIFSGNRLIIPR